MHTIVTDKDYPFFVSWGMGVESTALLAALLLRPERRDFELERLVLRAEAVSSAEAIARFAGRSVIVMLWPDDWAVVDDGDEATVVRRERGRETELVTVAPPPGANESPEDEGAFEARVDDAYLRWKETA